MSSFEIPRYLDHPEPIQVQCEGGRSVSAYEFGCLVPMTNGETELIIVFSEHYDEEHKRVRATKIGESQSDPSQWFVAFPSPSLMRTWINKKEVMDVNPVG